MMIVAIKTVDWSGLRPAVLRRAPVAETCAMVATVVLTVWTGNLALGVVAGVLAARCAALSLGARLVRQPD
jgi:SulP family sulfate permease